MKKHKIFSVICVVLIAVASPVCADNSGMDFLRIGVGARPVALGEAYTGLASDIYAVYWNPAGLAQLKREELAFAYNHWFEDIGYYFCGYAHLFGESAFAITLSYLGATGIEGRNEENVPTGDFDAYDVAPTISYSKRVSSEVLTGVNLRFVSEKLEDELANAFAIDLGILWLTGMPGLTIGGSLQNLGSKVEFISRQAPLPLRLRVGMAYTPPIEHPLCFALDFIRQDDSLHFSMGAEAGLGRNFFVRIGRRFHPSIDDGFRFGVGITLSNFSLDYAYLPHNLLGDTHQFGITFYFGEKKKIEPKVQPETEKEKTIRSLYEEGMSFFREKDYVEAIAKFGEVLLLDPENKEALYMMKEANRLLMEER